MLRETGQPFTELVRDLGNAVVKRLGPRVGVSAEPLRSWCKQADVSAGRMPGESTADAVTIKRLQAPSASFSGPARPF